LIGRVKFEKMRIFSLNLLPMVKVKALNIYPIKSLGGISVTEAIAMAEGFQYDRRWMLVDEKGQFLTQRSNSALAKFRCQLSDNELAVKFEDSDLLIPIDQDGVKKKKVQVWSSKLKANEVDPLFSEWFSEHLQQPCTLVKMTKVSKRSKRLSVAPFKTALSFADGYPYLILGTASMDKLNSLSPEIIPINRFRSNIELETTGAHEEDQYGEFMLGAAKMKVIKPCARCEVITINQKTGEKGKEPLKILAKYRRKMNKIYFGANVILQEEGLVRVGDELVVKGS